MAVIGFRIAEGLILEYCSLIVTIKSQNSNCKVLKIKTVQSFRVYEKHSMRQIKSSRTFNSTLPFTALQFC